MDLLGVIWINNHYIYSLCIYIYIYDDDDDDDYDDDDIMQFIGINN